MRAAQQDTPAVEGHAATTEVQVNQFEGTSRRAEPLLSFFSAVAREEGWEPGGELAAYRDRSTYFSLTDEGGSILGGLQLVAPDADGALPCVKVWPELAPDLAQSKGTIIHVAMLAIAQPWRSRRDAGSSAPFWRLTAAMWNHCVTQGVRELWLEATPRTLRAYKLVGWPLIIRGELRDHWGEPCYPCSLSIREVAGALTERAVRSDTYRRVVFDMIQSSDTLRPPK